MRPSLPSFNLTRPTAPARREPAPDSELDRELDHALEHMEAGNFVELSAEELQSWVQSDPR